MGNSEYESRAKKSNPPAPRKKARPKAEPAHRASSANYSGCVVVFGSFEFIAKSEILQFEFGKPRIILRLAVAVLIGA